MDVAIGAPVSGVSATASIRDASAGTPSKAEASGSGRTDLPEKPGGVGTSPPNASPPADPVQYATQLPDSIFATLMAKANLSVMIKAMQAYRAAMQGLDHSSG